jgi:hypothetical protein
MRNKGFTVRELVWGGVAVLVFSLFVTPTPIWQAVLVFITGQAIARALSSRN